MQKVADAVGVSSTRLLALGLWCDAAPFNRDRSKSLEMMTLNLPGIDTDMRIPLVAMPKDFFLKANATYDQLLEVVAWSFDILLSGKFPSKRHDGTPFRKNDVQRQKYKDLSLQRSILTEIRGDWAFYKHQLRLPGWREKAGCCWRCNCTKEQVAEVHSEAAWRKPEARLSHQDVLLRALEKGKTVSPMFAIPFCIVELCMIDWLHAVDLGVCPEFLGSIFNLFLEVLPGSNETEKCNALFVRIRQYYAEHECSSRLNRLCPTMLNKSNGKFPKLRAKAGEARDLVLFAKETADELLGNSTEHVAAKSCASSLLECYQCLSEDTFESRKFSAATTKYALQYVGLSALANAQGVRRWAVKPKLHLFLELSVCAETTPSKYWTYRDESFGGFVSSMCERRGGALTPISVGTSFFDRFAALHEVPSF